MYLSKKKKLILAWSIPAAVIVASFAVATPTVSILENAKFSKINKAKEYTPLSFEQIWDDRIFDFYNPKKYDINFFTYFIGSSVYLSDVFIFGELDKKIVYDENKNVKDIYWLSNDNIEYRVIDMKPLTDINDTQKNIIDFEITISKKYQELERTYKKTFAINRSDFSDSDFSETSFLKSAAQKFNQMLSKDEINFLISFEKQNSILDISQIKSPSDIEMNPAKSKGSFGSFRKVTSGENIYYQSDNDLFRYLLQNVQISIPTINSSNVGVWDVTDSFSFTAEGFDTTKPLFQFLLTEYQNGNLNYLPDVFIFDDNITQEQIIEKRIQKLIFDPIENVSLVKQDEFGNEIPASSYQAVLVKLELNNKTTYLVSWSNLFSSKSTIVENATELNVKIDSSEKGMLNYEEIQLPENYKYASIIGKPENNLIYKVKSISFDPSDTDFKKAIVSVEVSHPDLITTKVYKAYVTKGFMSKPYFVMEQQIKSLIGSVSNVSSISPTISLNNITEAQFKELDMSNLAEIEKKLLIKLPTGLTNVKYSLHSARLDGNVFVGTFKISPINDLNNFWTVDGITQILESNLKLVSSTA